MSCLNCTVPVKPLPSNVIDNSKQINQVNNQPNKFITIFDYDDTIFPSTWVSQIIKMRIPISEEIKSQLDLVDKNATTLVQEACKHSIVLIITNAEEGWVQESSKLFMPRFYSLLDSLTVVSARSRYEHLSPSCSTIWKEQAFKDEIEKLSCVNDSLSILSIGDSLHERNAIISYSKFNSKALVKSIKMIECPSPSHLATQQKLIFNSVCQMIFSSSKLDLKLSIQNA